MTTILQIHNLYKGYSSGQEKEPQWVLANVNLDLKQGGIYGIMGSNGSGKSTLLKIISRITAPTMGHVRGWGKIISMLETGSAFHPELSGFENIHLNGAMLGATKKIITAKLDEIVEFSGLLSYMNLPLKKYSTGMQLRLAFSIATHLNPDILILDEILAVADMDFQEKCLKKLKSLNNEFGTTILQVSHLTEHLKAICDQGFVIHNGTTTGITRIGTTIQEYEALTIK